LTSSARPILNYFLSNILNIFLVFNLSNESSELLKYLLSVINSYKTQPADHISVLDVCPFSFLISGLIYSEVPQLVNVLSKTVRDTPKSPILI